MSGQGAAFLDLDHTLIDTDAGLHFARHLVETKRELVRQAQGPERRRLRWAHTLRMLEVGVKASYLLPLYRARLLRRSRLVRESYAFFRGERVEELRAMIEGFFQEHLRRRVYPGVPQLLQWHRDRGEPTVIVTSAPRTAAKLFAKELGVDHAVGVSLEHVDGVLSGRVARGPLWGGDKLAVARKLCRENKWELGSSFCYSDHGSDQVFLAAVGRPVAVHPDRSLLRAADRHDWPVLDLRDTSGLKRALGQWAANPNKHGRH